MASGEDDETARQGVVARTATPSEAQDDALIGARVGHFLVRSKLGAGGMGVVYEAVDERLGRVVALKMLLAKSESPQMRRRFVREARAASKIHHPHVATIFEAGDAELGAYIAMEYVKGETLRRWLRESRPLAEKVRIAREIADALGTAHQNGIVHRDLKPDNVMVTVQGAAKVLDFGLATQGGTGSLGTDDTRTAEGIVVGTPNYMSPEQVRGAVLDARSDVFSMGVLLYEAFTGERPFQGATPAAVFLALGAQEPRPPRELAPEISRPLEAVVLRCLAKRPEDRYADGTAVARALAGAGAGAGHRSRAPLGATLAALGMAATLAIVFAYRHAIEPKLPTQQSAVPNTSAQLPPTRVAKEGADASAADDPKAKVEALEAMRRGLRAERELADNPCAAFEEATRIAPLLAAAHLRLATCRFAFSRDTAGARLAFREAERLRDSLTERDRGLFEAWEPMLAREPPDAGVTRSRSLALATRFSDDAELAMFAAIAEEGAASSGALELHRRVAELDPGSAFAHASIGRVERKAGHIDEARRAIDRCLEIAPNAVPCVVERIADVSARGLCNEVEAAAQRLAGSTAARASAALAIGDALLGTGRSVGEVRETVAGLLSDAGQDRADVTLVRARLDAVAGDFDAVIQRLKGLDAGQGPEERASHGRLLAGALREAGRDDAEVARLAKRTGVDDQTLLSLERSTRACDLLTSPIEHMESEFSLGQLRESRGDRALACASYEKVLAFWRDAKPRSVTARKARARAAALACTR